MPGLAVVAIGARRVGRQRGYRCADRESGTRFAARLLPVVATCRQRGRLLLDFLVAAGEAALRGHRPPSLLPTL